MHVHVISYKTTACKGFLQLYPEWNITSIKIIKNEVGYRDDTVPKMLKQESTVRRIESMQQSSATPKNQDVGRGLRKIVACSQSSLQCRLVSTVFGTLSSLHF